MFLNPAGNTWSAPERRPEGDPRALHRTLAGFAPTPLVDAPGLAAEFGVGRVLVKDEHLRAGLPSFKILGAAWAVFRALGGREGGFDTLVVDPELTLVSATAGNHGRAVAHLARVLGVASDIYIPAGTAPARVEAIRAEGANVHIVDGDYETAVAAAEAHTDGKPLVVGDVGGSMTPVWACEGYSTILREIDEQLDVALRQDEGGVHRTRHRDARPEQDDRGDHKRDEVDPGRHADMVVVPVGGGTFGRAVVEHYRGAGPRPRILTVEPEGAACLLKSLTAGRPVQVPGPHPSTMAGLNTGEVDAAAWPYLRDGVDAAVAVSDEEVWWGMRALADESIVAGECGAASAAGARAYFAQGNPLGLSRDSTVVLISTEGVHDPEAYERIVSRS